MSGDCWHSASDELNQTWIRAAIKVYLMVARVLKSTLLPLLHPQIAALQHCFELLRRWVREGIEILLQGMQRNLHNICHSDLWPCHRSRRDV